MSDERHEDRLDDILREAAQEYNRPPQTPREHMWSRIEARRRGPRSGDSGLGADASDADSSGLHTGIIPLRRSRNRRWMQWAVGIAAALVLGFGLGRWGRGPEHGSRGPAVANAPAPTPTRASGPESTAKGEPRPVARDVAALPPSTAATLSPPAYPRERVELRTKPAEPGRGQIARAESPVPGPQSQVPSAAYTLAAIQHFTQAEALLTSFRAEARSGKQMDAQLSAWAKDLLVSTRLMLDSPAGRDPRMRRLLEDLELVLAQIAQLGGQRAGDERNLIDEAVEGRNVLPRLRTTIPAGARPVGS